MAINISTYRIIADITLWYKVREGDDLVLSDISKIIPLRWDYFKKRWEFIRSNIEAKVNDYIEPDYLRTQIQDMDDFIASQRSSSEDINPFDNEDALFRFHGIFENMVIEDIDLTKQEENLIKAETNKVVNFTKNDFLRMRAMLVQARDEIADEIGLTDDDYNNSKHRSPIPQQLIATISDLTRMNLIQGSILSLEYILANVSTLSISYVDPFALARQNANNPEIDIRLNRSGRLVRLHYGESLEQLAYRYYGDNKRWIDIAIANGLKPPYIDEVGEKISLIANADGNQINIAGTDSSGNLNIDKLFINQIVFLRSDTQKFADQRTISNIKEVPVSGELIIKLDGESDLAKYKISENAYLHVFKPNTTNSTFFIMIPSETPTSEDINEETPFFLTTSRQDEKRAKIDFAIGDDGELLFNSTGDIQLSYGLANAIQAIKLLFSTPEGGLKKHPTYGLINLIGNTSNFVNIKAALIQSINRQIARDPRFDRVESITVDEIRGRTTTLGRGAYITLVVRLSGSGNTVPISFKVDI